MGKPLTFDAYRDADARKLMIEYVMASRFMDAATAIAQLGLLDHVGLAYVYRDALALVGKAQRADANYDPIWGNR